jgi:L-arabinokinase
LQTDFFPNASPRFSGTGPGRLDVMGGIADYSGSLVLQMPIREHTRVTLALRADGLLRIRTLSPGEPHPLVELPYAGLLREGQPDYDHAGWQLAATPGGNWAAYVAGCLLVLHREKGIRVTGADVLVDSQVPAGKGVSSSAALEVATMRALAEAYGLKFEGTELPTLAQRVENRVVGAPCGLMDQLASHLGEPNKLLPILCQPDHLSPPFPVPAGVRFVGIDSGVRHAVGGASYSDVRTAAFMGYSMLAQSDGATPGELAHARRTGEREHLLYNGYLANIEPSGFEERYAGLLPRQLSGADFLARYGGTIDPTTEVQPDRTYDVYHATRHPIYENTRIQYFSLLLQHLPPETDAPNRERCLRQLGEWMFQSHEGYSACGLGNARTDELVWQARKNTRNGVYGARITGGGSGGTVCFLCAGDVGLETARRIHQEYQEKHGEAVHFFEPQLVTGQ